MYDSCKYSGTFEHFWSITSTIVNISSNSAWSIKMYVCTVLARSMSNTFSVDDISHVTHLHLHVKCLLFIIFSKISEYKNFKKISAVVDELLHASAAKKNSAFSEPFVVKMSISPPKNQSYPSFMFKTNRFVRSEVLAAVTMNNSDFLDVTSCQNLLPPSSGQNTNFSQVYIMSHPRKYYS